MEEDATSVRPMDGIPPSDSQSANQPRVRRRNRMITSCLECRRRKLKCDKQQPCTNCQKFSRECMFLAPALDTLSQKKLNEIKEKMGSLERTLEDDVARRRSEHKRKAARKSSADLPGEGSESDEGPVPEDERGLEATPLATVDAAYDVDGEDNDDVLDLGFRVGKFRMTERLGGLFRPKLAEEMVFALVRDNKRGTEPEAPLKDDNESFLEPGPSFVAPGSGFLFGDPGSDRSILEFLPPKGVTDLLLKRYYNNCHLIAKTVHWPSFQQQYETFWTLILSGIEPPAAIQALVFAVCFSAVATMSFSEVDTVFQQSYKQVMVNFQQATEMALAKAHVLRTTKFDTLQALIIYLIPMCRGELSRSHSVLVGAAIRLGECFGLHRDPLEIFGHSPIDTHVRRLAWFQLCFLDFRTAESQGPRPAIKREDYDTKLPWNLDDVDLIQLQPEPNRPVVDLKEKEGQWTDTTLTKIRFECCEMHRIVWHDRIRLDKQKISITYVLSKIESFRSAMEKKYHWLDTSITIQAYARTVLDILLLRMHIMVLHKYHNATSTRIPDRLRQIIINSGTTLSESAVRLEIDAKFDSFKWYNSAIQQWHTAFLLLVEVFVFPNRKEADRIWSIVDHVFQPDLSLTRVQKARSILAAVRDRAGEYRNLRRLREPVSMRNRLKTNLPARGRIRGPEMIQPEVQLSRQTSEIDPSHGTYATATQLLPPQQQSIPRQMLGVGSSTSSVSGASESWTFDTPYNYYVREENRASIPRDSNSAAITPSPQHLGIQHSAEPSPGSSSQLTESWPPNFSTVQDATFRYNMNAVSPRVVSPSPPTFDSNSPLDMNAVYGNSAMGVVSGQFIPQGQPQTGTNVGGNLAGNTTKYDTSQANGFGMSSEMTAQQVSYPGQMSATQIHAEWNPMQRQPPVTKQQDIPMLDIDWSEWDKLFPVEVNNGELDLPSTMV